MYTGFRRAVLNSKPDASTPTKPKQTRKTQPKEPIEPEPAYNGPVSQLQINGNVPKTVEWWAAECNLAQAHLRIARDGLRLVKEREQLKRAKKARDLQKQRD